jgi:hypothetical protein
MRRGGWLCRVTEKDIQKLTEFDGIILSEKKYFLGIILFGKWFFQF